MSLDAYLLADPTPENSDAICEFVRSHMFFMTEVIYELPKIAILRVAAYTR